MRNRLMGLLALLLVACGGSGGGVPVDVFEIPEIPLVPSSAKVSSEVTEAQDIPMAEEPTDDLLLALLEHCAGRQDDAEAHVLANVVHSRRHELVVRWSLALYEQVVANDDRLAKWDRPVRWVPEGGTPGSGDSINVVAGSSVPGLPKFNAFALNDVVVMLDPLMDAFLEGAAYWDRLLEEANDIESEIDAVELLAGLGVIFRENADLNFASVVPESEINDRIATRPFAFEAYWGAVAYVVFHELGHSNLRHGVFKCLVETGIEDAIEEANLEPTPQEEDALEIAFVKLDRGTETQADIYAATIAERAGFSTNGAAVFVLGLISLNVVSGKCDGVKDDAEAFELCIFSAEPQNDHPPLDVRAKIAVAVIDEGQDLTPFLEILEAFKIG